MNVWKENLLILEIVQSLQFASGRHALEEPRRRLVGGDARRGEKPYHAVGPYEGHGALDEQGVEVDVASGQEGIVAAVASHADRGRCALTGFLEVTSKRVSGLLQVGDHAFAVGRTLGHGDFAALRREPLDLLQLHPVPGRIADHSVEAAGQPGAFPLRPHTGKSHLPIEEAFVVEKLLCFVEQSGKPLTRPALQVKRSSVFPRQRRWDRPKTPLK